MDRLSKTEMDLVLGYAEGHDLELVKHEGNYKLEDLQEPGCYWARNSKEVIQWVVDANDDLLECEMKEDFPNEERIKSLLEDKPILEKAWEKIFEN